MLDSLIEELKIERDKLEGIKEETGKYIFRIFICCSMDCWFPYFCAYPTRLFSLLEFYRLPCN